MAVIAIPIADYSARSEPHRGDAEDPWTLAARSVKSVHFALRVNSDPVLRTIVCRIPYTNFTLDTLARATRINSERIASALGELVVMGLVTLRTEPQGDVVVTPASESAQSLMREAAEKWCNGSDDCDLP